MVGHIMDRLAPRVAFLVRHPCAVVASRLALGWHADVRDILSQEQLVEDHLSPWVASLEAERDLIGAHAAWWAIETRVAALQLSTRPHYFSPYETILQDPLSETTRMAHALGISSEGIERVDSRAPSRATQEPICGASARDLAGRWRKKLGAEHTRRILAWAYSFSAC